MSAPRRPGRPPNRVLGDLGARTVKAESAIREALTALVSGKAVEARRVLQQYESWRQDQQLPASRPD